MQERVIHQRMPRKCERMLVQPLFHLFFHFVFNLISQGLLQSTPRFGIRRAMQCMVRNTGAFRPLYLYVIVSSLMQSSSKHLVS